MWEQLGQIMDLIDIITATIILSALGLVVTLVVFIRGQIPNWPFRSDKNR